MTLIKSRTEGLQKPTDNHLAKETKDKTPLRCLQQNLTMHDVVKRVQWQTGLKLYH